MKYTYHFANGDSQEIEVTEALYLILKDADRIEYNNDHANTRHHVSMDMVEADEGMQFADPTQNVSDILDTKYASSSLHQAIACLPADQRELILDVYFRDIKLVEIARRDGVSRSAISHRLATAEKNLKNFLI